MNWKKAVILAVTGLVFALPMWSTGQSGGGGGASIQAAGESPMLKALVDKGALPKLQDRLPKEPAVRPTLETIGKYGGTMQVLATDDGVYQDMQLAVDGANLYRIPMAGIGIEPNLAKAYEISKDQKTFTITLREGTKWSDGAPFTTEDIRFWMQDMQPDKLVRTWGVTSAMSQTEVVSPLVVKVTNPNGLGGFKVTATDWDSGWAGIYAPAHYLKKWHGKYNPDAAALAKSEGFDTWYAAIADKYFWAPASANFAKLPRMNPWIYTTRGTSAMDLERNPYYWAVDAKGNQLPYIDKIHVTIVDPEVYQLKVQGGAADFAVTGTRLSNMTLYKAGEKAGNYRTVLWPSNTNNELALEFNLWNPDPVMRPIEANVHFREALSLAINRDEINKVMFFGLAVVRQSAPFDDVSYNPAPKWGNYMIKYDKAQANKLLDEMGLTKKNADGIRLRSDGKVLQMVLEYADPLATPGLELIKEYWGAIGVNTIIKLEDGALLEQRMFASEHDVILDGWNQEGDERTLYGMIWHWDTQATGNWDDWQISMRNTWRDQVGKGNPIPADYLRKMPTDTSKIVGEKPPDSYISYLEARGNIATYDLGSKEYKDAGFLIWDTWSKNLWNIGTVGQAPNAVIVKNTIGNFPDPKKYIKGQRMDHPLIAHFADVLFFK
jgi:peptide/nickel transport system substrate-binding protein